MQQPVMQDHVAGHAAQPGKPQGWLFEHSVGGHSVGSLPPPPARSAPAMSLGGCPAISAGGGKQSAGIVSFPMQSWQRPHPFSHDATILQR